MTYDELVSKLSLITPKNGVLIIAIDGDHGAGKTEFAKLLTKSLKISEHINFDQYLNQDIPKTKSNLKVFINEDYDWDKIQFEIFDPIILKETRLRGVYSWKTLNEPVIIESTYAFQQRFLTYYDFKIWIECSGEKQKENLINREVDLKILEDKFFNNLCAVSKNYIKKENPVQYANVIVNSDKSNYGAGYIHIVPHVLL